MRYKQYLNEGYNPHAEELLKGLQVVYTHCMPYIKDLVKGGYDYIHKDMDLLYSGRNNNEPILPKDVRKDREPLDTDSDLHQILDDMMYKKFKMRGRSNSIFCTGDFLMAGGYGSNVYLIFPANKYQVLWSDSIRDLYNDRRTMFIAHLDREYLEYRNKILMGADPNKIDGLIMSLPTNIYALPDTHEYKKKLINNLNKKVMSTYHKGDIIGAIKSKNEIMVSCKYYIGLKHSDYNRVIKQYIHQKGITFPDKDVFYEWYERYIE